MFRTAFRLRMVTGSCRTGAGWSCRCYLVVCVLILAVLGPQLGTELFPQVDSGKFVLRFRMPPGTNYELTRQAWIRCLEAIEEEAGPDKVKISMGFAGQQAPNYGMNNMLLFMRGPDDGQMRVALREGSGIHLDEFRERLRKVLPGEAQAVVHGAAEARRACRRSRPSSSAAAN